MDASLTPERLMRLYSQMPLAGERFGALVGNAFRLSESSRVRCAHLLHLFTPDNWSQVTLWDLYQTHYRWLGRCRWQEVWARFSDSPEEAFAVLRAEKPPLHWGLVEAACETSRQLAPLDGKTALVLARSASDTACRITIEVLGERCREELLALTWATVGNAHRVLDQLESAREAMTRAQEHLERAHPPLLRLAPRILSLRVSLEYWDRHFSQALRTTIEALGLDPEPTLRGQLLVNQARILTDLRRSPEALACLQEAITLIRREEDSRLWCCAVHNQLLVLSELGRLDEAKALLRRVRSLILKEAVPLDALKVQWVEARIAMGCGDARRAESLYRQVRDGFLKHNLPYRAAVVTLELCRLLLEQGRLEEVKTEAASTLQEFHRQKVAPEFISALVLVEQAVLGQRLTLRVLQQARNLLERRAGR